MRIIECDRCHKKVTDPEKVGHVRITWHSARTDELITAAESYDWDFCDGCMQEIEEFVRSKKKETVKPAETKKKADRYRTDQGTAQGRVEHQEDS